MQIAHSPVGGFRIGGYGIGLIGIGIFVFFGGFGKGGGIRGDSSSLYFLQLQQIQQLIHKQIREKIVPKTTPKILSFSALVLFGFEAN